jgi:elongation factor P
MAIPATQIRNGMVLLVDGRPHRVVSKEHITPGKGNAVVQTVLTDLQGGGTVNRRFRSAEAVETASLETHELQYLYRSGDDYTLMNTETYEMIGLPEGTLGDSAKYLQENMIIVAQYWNGKVVAIEVPMTVDFRITACAPPMKGATASGGPKPATLENGLVVKVPQHLNVGDKVRIDTRDDSFVERVTD